MILYPSSPADLSRHLLRWYDAGHRQLPWRPAPGALGDAYQVWLSEVMLQQTTVAAVIPYYTKFLQRWATLADLAAATDADVMSAWAGLGYYSRARNLLVCARQVMTDHGGAFPQTAAEISRLPGCGPYTSAAIAAIAFGEPVAAVDGNVERVLSRLMDDATLLPKFKAKARTIAQGLVPKARAGDFVQASIELGATVCRPKDPNCAECPWQDACQAKANGTIAHRPNRPPKAAKPQRSGLVYWVERDEQVWLVRRPESGLLGGMLAFPSSAWEENLQLVSADCIPTDWSRTALNTPVRHVFTHFSLDLTVVKVMPPAQADVAAVMGVGQWQKACTVMDAGLPTVMKKVAKLVLG